MRVCVAPSEGAVSKSPDMPIEGLFHGLGVAVLIGVSRKSSLPILAAEGLGAPASGFGADAGTERLGGGLSLSLIAAQQGAQFFRTHDVAPTCQALSILMR